MKKINTILILSLAIFTVSCGASKYMMKDIEIAEKKYTIDGWSVLKDGKKVGTLTSTEWELYKNKFVREISVATSFTKDEDMFEIARFLHSKFPDAKIEVNEDSGNSFD